MQTCCTGLPLGGREVIGPIEGPCMAWKTHADLPDKSRDVIGPLRRLEW